MTSQTDNQVKPDARTERSDGSLHGVVRALAPTFIGIQLGTVLSLMTGTWPSVSIGMMIGMVGTVGVLHWKRVL